MDQLHWYVVLAIAVGMGMDVFSVSMAVAAGPRQPRQSFRLSFHFGLFQLFMPLLGWLVGKSVIEYVKDYDHWIAFGMLAAIGAHMVYEGFKPEEEKSQFDRSKGLSLVVLSLATSIDALGVGLSFGVMGSRILIPALIIGVISSAMSLIAIYLGRRLRSTVGHRMEIIGGIILIGIGIKLLMTV